MPSLPRNSIIVCILGAVLLTASACRVENGGLAAEGVSVDRSGGASGNDITQPSPPPRGGSETQPPIMDAGQNGESGEDAPARDGEQPVSADAQAQPDADAGSVVDVAPEVGPAAACEDLPALPRPVVDLGRGPRSDDMAFDDQGHLFSFDGRDIVRLRRDLSRELVARAVIGNRGGTLRVAREGLSPDGPLIVGDFMGDTLFALSYDGRPGRLGHPISRPMKMVWGPQQRLFVSERTGTITRVDLATDQVLRGERLPFRPGGLAFSPDFQTLYVGSSDREGLFKLEVRPDQTLGPPRPWLSGIESVAALATDVCGHLYVLSEGDRRVRRWKEGQGWQVVANLGEPYLWSLAFGSGQGGWSATALYVQDASGGRLFEIELGVRGAAPPP